MIQLRKSEDRGHADHGWLDTYHTFSFAGYYDPQHMGFRALRVINEDRVAAGRGFGSHGHEDMEILTYLVDGELAHRDSMGNGSTLRRGDVQRMTAGTGVVHSEMNGSRERETHLLQIWILPEREGLQPGYEEQQFADETKRGGLRLIAGRDARDGALSIHQDVDIYASILEPGGAVEHRLSPGRHAWVQVVRGELTVNGTDLGPGDGAAISGEERLVLEAQGESEVLIFDLA